MKKAVLAVVLLIGAAPAFSAPSPDLRRQARLLLRDIRAASLGAHAETSSLRAELSGLQAKNKDFVDDLVDARLHQAGAELDLLDAGSPLPPPSSDETGEDLPDRDAVAQPAAPPSASTFRNDAPAALPETAGAVFDGSGRGGPASPPVVVPSEAPAVELDRYLSMTNDAARAVFLVSESAGLLGRLQEKDEKGLRSQSLAARLNAALAAHPKRSHFVSARVLVTEDGRLHLVYRLDSGEYADEVLGLLSEWTTPKPASTKPPHKKKHGKPSKDKKKEDGDEESSSHHVHKSGHGAGGSAGGGRDGRGGVAGAGGPGGGERHAKGPHVKGGDSDGGAESGQDRGGRNEVPSLGAGRGLGAKASDLRPHALPGRSISGGRDGSRPDSRKNRDASEAEPKDFTSRGGGSRLRGGYGALGSSFGNQGGGYKTSVVGEKDSSRNIQALPVAPSAASDAAVPQGTSSAASVPFTAEGDLRDAVAANTAGSPAPVPQTTSPAPASAPVSQLLAAACLIAAAAGSLAWLRILRPA